MDIEINYLRTVIKEHKAVLLEIAMLGRQMRNVQTVYFKTEAQKAVVEQYESKFDKAIDEVLLNLRRECDADGLVSISVLRLCVRWGNRSRNVQPTTKLKLKNK